MTIVVVMSCCLIVSGFVLIFVVYIVLLNMVCFLSLRVGLCIISLCSGCDGCCVFVSYVHPVAV